MNQVFKILLITLVLTSCSQDSKPKPFEFKDYNFESLHAQADSLLLFLTNAILTDTMNHEYWDQKFFCAFPNSFKEMEAILGYDDVKETPLNYTMGRNVVYHFSILTDIPDSIYYNKFIRINIDGYWQADNIQEGFHFDQRLIKYPIESCKYLSKFSDNEIKSVYRFIFDGPHPKNKFNEELYNKLNSIIENQNKKLAALLTQAYNEVMAKDDGHGH